jgi:hypothetical protein
MDKPPYPKAAQEASQGVTHGVIEQESADGIVVPEYRDEGRNAERRKGIP